MIAKGTSSDDFYFFTLPSSPPSDLECVASTFESLDLKWKYPDPNEMFANDTVYHFSYNLVKSMFTNNLIFYLKFCRVIPYFTVQI